MKFALYPPRLQNGQLKWPMYEMGKRWPFYHGYAFADDFDTAYKAFEGFVASAKAHYQANPNQPIA